MNEATPPWRTFSSDAPAQAASGPASREPQRSVPRWLLPLLIGLAGLSASVAIISLVVLVSGVLAAVQDEPPLPGVLPALSETGVPLQSPAGPAHIVVDVAGAVARPGLHRLRPGDRVGDAIEAAGGFAPRADLAASSQTLNLAQPLEDGTKVLVPELGIDRPSSAAAPAADGRIDINHAGQSELESLPGIGPVTASKIIAAREAQRFDAVRELRSRGIVGDSVYEDIEGLVVAS